VLFGPPGAGKSTLVAALGGLDLERIDTKQARIAAAAAVVAMARRREWPDQLVLGAADTSPEAWPRVLFTRVLLLPDKLTYYERRAARDAQRPWKAAQGDYYKAFEAMRHNFQVVLSLPDQILTPRPSITGGAHHLPHGIRKFLAPLGVSDDQR